MQIAIHRPLAILMLLVPAAAALVAQPAQAQQRAVVAQAQAPVRAIAPLPVPGITQFTVRPQGRLVAGRELRFRLEGAAGGRASLDIPGVAKDIALRETRRGVYEGTYTVRRRDDLRAFEVAVATLHVGGAHATARVDLPESRADRRDREGPSITQVTPSNGARLGERGRTYIQARLGDDASGVDIQSVRLVVDGLDVTRNAHVSADEIGYRERLGRGRHSAELVVRDRAGNLSRTAWTFQVL